ncbi:hypothetical protein WS67_07995 [Burkholderia singularis]|uniref:D-amino-acid oxidase n=1 Tax=Burkholderia singularis TaxID=1503053 RepID=A0A103E5C3_9BURK|nr:MULTISPECIES: FAD-dependent oxidoreductase [Burkholderia]AOK31509.1 hypothetical protein AQ611_18225 [Burkholderia sp. Bp7605]KVE28652.1 hypothetical protein WS67_07995 [Burkholderia singularis]SMG02243.1 D-amino-acid oxidase [Burkholderia singularis]
MQANDVMLRVEAAVLGAGIIGSAIAAALVEQGIHTALIDEGSAGNHGASRYSGGISRIYDRDPAISSLAAHEFRCADSVVTRTIAATRRKTGMLYLGLNESDLSLRRCIAAHASAEYPMRLLTRSEVAAISSFPQPRSDEAVLYEPNAGIGNVRAAAGGLANYVKDHGVLLENLGVSSVHSSSDSVCVETDGATLFARVAVIACGASSASLLGDLPLTARSIPLMRVAASKPLELPVIDAIADSYAVPLSGGLIHAGSRVREGARLPEQLQWRFGDAIKKDALHRLSVMTGVRERGPVIDILRGHDCYSPDGRPIVGFVDAAATRYAATAMNGIGYKLASPLSQLIAQQIAQRLRNGVSATPDLLVPFAPDRFSAIRVIGQAEGV